MSEFLFDRIGILRLIPNQVTQVEAGVLRANPQPTLAKEYRSRLEDGSPGFRIRFSVNKISEPTPNTTSIFIYNLSSESRALFQQINNTVELEAGYGDSPELIFRGNIQRTRTRKIGPDYVTQIEAGDGLFNYTNSRIDVSVGAGVNYKDVVKTLTDAFGLAKGEQTGIPSKQILNGRVLSGPVRDQLSQVLGSEDLDWSIQDGGLVILPKNAASGTPAFVLSPDTGLLGIPEQKDAGIEFKSLLMPKLRPFQSVVVLSKFINGTYRCLNVTHDGDTFEGPWETKVEAA